MTKRIAVVFAAAALFSSGAARAQAHRTPGATPPPAQEQEQPTPKIPTVGKRPAPAPQQQPGQQPTQATPQQGQLTEEQRQMLGTIRDRNAILKSMGDLARQRGQSNEVRAYGQRLWDENSRVESELSQILAERGANVEGLPRRNEELGSNHERYVRLQGLPPDQFDREFAVALKDLGRQYEADLKRMRDQTPGSDARLKSWLDQTENVAEDYRLAAQQLVDSQDAQRQGRRPAPLTGR
jgi:putative membrane protein